MKNEDKPKQVEAADAIIQITEHARKEISWVHTAYRFIAGAVTLIIAVGIYFTFKSASEFKDDILQEGQRAQVVQKVEFDALEKKLRQDLQSSVDDMRKDVAKRIDAEFDAKQISELVQNKAKERIDAIADILIEKDIANQIAPIRADFLEQLSQSKVEIRERVEKLDADSKQTQKTEAELQATIAEARQLLAKLDEQSVFVLTAIAAQFDDRKAYETLSKWSQDANYHLKDEAVKVKSAIQLSYYDPHNLKPFTLLSWDDANMPSTFGRLEIAYNWKAVPSTMAKAYVDFVWGHTNLTRDDKLYFLRSVIEDDSRNSLLAVDRAANILAGELKAKYNPCFVFTDIEKKWSEWEKTNSMAVVLTTGASTNSPQQKTQ